MTTFGDDFNRVNATTLGANWTRQEGDDFFEIVSNAAKWVAGGYSYERYNAVSADAPDMFAQAYLTTPSTPGGFPGVTARCATSGLTCYAGSFDLIAQKWSILRYTGSGITETLIAACATTGPWAASTTYKVRLEVSGTGATVTLKLFVDDVEKVSTTDSSVDRVTSGTQAGLTTAGSTQNIFDDFTGGDLGGTVAGRMFLARAKA